MAIADRRKRRLKRTALADVLYARKGALFRRKEFKRADVEDISATGIRIRTRESIPSGVPIEIVIRFAKHPGLVHPPPPIKAQASVVRCQPAEDNTFHTGLTFTKIAKQDEKNLHFLLDIESFGEKL